MGNKNSFEIGSGDQRDIVSNKNKLEDLYTISTTKLGRGHYATVWEGECKKTKRKVAIKKIRKSLTDEKRLHSEINVLRKVGKHENIVELIDFFETPREVQLVMEMCTGGELFERLAEKGPYSEADCAKHIKAMAEAVLFLHSKNIVHRDLKPENILLSTDDENVAIIKVADFGLAKIVTGTNMKTKCGTWGYSAPEMVSGSGCAFGYDAKVDSWSIGTILYILLCGYHPFDPLGRSTDNIMMKCIKTCQFSFDDNAWINITESAKDLVRRLLVLDPESRYSMEQILEHEWIQGGEGIDIPVCPLSPTIHQDLARYTASSRDKSFFSDENNNYYDEDVTYSSHYE